MEPLRTNPRPFPLADIAAIARQRNGGPDAISVYGSPLACDLPSRRAPLAEPRDLRQHGAVSRDTKRRVPGRVATRTQAGGDSPVHAVADLFTPPSERRTG